MTTPQQNSAPDKRKRDQQIAQSTLMLMIFFGISKGISLVQTFILARVFGLETEYEAYIAAARIPDLIVLLLGGGALGYAFIPIFSGLLAKGETDDAWRLASQVVNTVFTAAFFASVLAFIFTPFIITRVVAPGFDAETTALSVSLMRILLIGTLVFSVSGIVMGMLHSHNHFLLPAIAPIVNDVGILFGVVFLLDDYGIYGLVYGAVLGAFLHLSVQIPGLIRFRARWFPDLGWNDPQLWRVIRLMLPRLAGLGVSSINLIIMTNLSTQLGRGATAATEWGWRLMQIPQTLIGSAMGIVIFPTLSALSAMDDAQGKRNAMSGALRFVMLATIPSSIGLVLIGQPLLSLLEGGAFDASATALVYSTVRAFSLGIIVHSMLEVVARSFYADKDTVTPLWAAVAGAALNVTLAYTLTGIAFGEGRVDNVSGIALANSLGVALEVSILIVILRRRWHGIDENSLASTTLKTILASLIMGLAVIGVEMAFTALGLSGSLVHTVVQIGVQVTVGGVVFFIATLILRMREVTQIIALLLRRTRTTESIQTA